jgi:TPR repeat protein
MDWPTHPNGPYASALSKTLLEGGNRPIEDVFRTVADSVWSHTRHRQEPGYYSDLRSRVWLDAGRLSVHSRAAADIGAAGAEDVRSVKHYQAGLEVAPPMGQPITWNQDFRRLTDAAESLDDRQARQAIASARRSGASVMEQTLGGMMLETSWPEQRALDQAQELFLRAARKGYVPAQVFLGELAYRRRNYALAYTWLRLSAQEGSTRAELDVDDMLIEQAMLSKNPNAIQQGYQQYMQAENAALQGFSHLLDKAMAPHP